MWRKKFLFEFSLVCGFFRMEMLSKSLCTHRKGILYVNNFEWGVLGILLWLFMFFLFCDRGELKN